jgi:predicted thioesterase
MSTVGTDLKIKHTAATPVGMAMRAAAELVEADGRWLVFAVKAEAKRVG